MHLHYICVQYEKTVFKIYTGIIELEKNQRKNILYNEKYGEKDMLLSVFFKLIIEVLYDIGIEN